MVSPLNGGPRIEVAPTRALVDEPVSIRLSSLPPNAPVTLRARMRDHLDQAWASEAVFVAGPDGTVDVARQAPRSGTYSGVDSMGLFWSMAREPDGGPRTLFVLATLTPLTVTLAAELADAAVATTSLERLLVADQVTIAEVGERGLVGRYFQPLSATVDGAVLVFGGSPGGLIWSLHVGAVLASRGIPALALAYFGLDRLPRELARVPLEYFATALDWLAGQPGVREDALAVMGISRGGELALLLGATFPRIRAVVAYAPSHVVHAGVKTGEGAEQPAWTYQGAALPFVPPSQDLAELAEPIALRSLFLRALENAPAVERATIPVERISGPVLLISGKDDQLWPSTLMAERVLARLAAQQHPYPDLHLSYEGAGHMIGLPFLPTTATAGLHRVLQRVITVGGSAQETACAGADSWPRVLRFLNEQLAVRARADRDR